MHLYIPTRHKLQDWIQQLFFDLSACTVMGTINTTGQIQRWHNSAITKFYMWKYLSDHILKCFSSILLNVLLSSSYKVILLTRGVLFACLRIDKERSHIMLVNIGGTTEVRKDQPAGQDQLCIWPDWDPVISKGNSFLLKNIK